MPCEYQSRRQYLNADKGSNSKEHGIHHASRICQFKDVKEEELFEFDGRKWCQFHLPIKNKEGLKSEKYKWDVGTIAKFNEKILGYINNTGQAFWPKNIIDLQGVVFPGDFKLVNKRIKLNINFSESYFYKSALFRGLDVNGCVNFERVRCLDGMRFEACTFRDINFANSVLPQFHFTNNVATGKADFHSVYFLGYVSFIDTKFAGTANYSISRFGGDVEFDSYNGATFKRLICTGSIFDKSVSFLNREFTGTTNFSGCEFKYAPKFHNCNFHEDTSFRQAIFHDIREPDAPTAYRTLKLAMEKVRARIEHARFYALEQKSIRNQYDTPRWVKLSSALYDLISDYGQSAIRPMAWLAGSILLFFVFYYSALLSETNAVALSIKLSIEQVVRPFFIWSKDLSEASIGLRLLATAQSILSITFITLFILAIRWRFTKG